MSDAPQRTTMSKPVTPEATYKAQLEMIAEQVHKLWALKAQQAATQAEMIRACVAKIQEEPGTCNAARRAVTQLERATVIREHKREQDEAFLYLLALATMLENQSVR